MTTHADAVVEVAGLDKTFALHLRGGVKIGVLRRVSMTLAPGECVALRGPSGIGKSTLLRCIYGNYRPLCGVIRVRDGANLVDIAAAHPRRILGLRRTVIGHVSQFLRVIPRVAAIDLVMEPLRLRGVDTDEARERAATILQRLNLPEQLWEIPPATFSGGEQQRINAERVLVAGYPVLLLDEPTASLDAGNRDAVTALIRDAVARGAAVLGVFHDATVRGAVATREVDLASAGAGA